MISLADNPEIMHGSGCIFYMRSSERQQRDWGSSFLAHIPTNNQIDRLLLISFFTWDPH